jgi:NAD(P)H-dependent FMN reductase
MRIFGLAGSLRGASLNSALLRTAAGLIPEGSTLEIGTIAGIPLYDGDLEAQSGIPAAVTVVKEQIAASDAVLLVTPEYNNSIPGAFKNAIDWASRPPADIERVFGGKPVALMGASPGAFGTILSQDAWLPVLRTLGMDLWASGRLMVTRAGGVFDEHGNLADPRTGERLKRFLAGFVAYVSERPRA